MMIENCLQGGRKQMSRYECRGEREREIRILEKSWRTWETVQTATF